MVVRLMSGFAHAYVHRGSIGNEAGARAFIAATEPEIERLYDQGSIEGYQLAYVDSAEEAEKELVLTSRIASLVAERFPYVYLRIQPKDGDPGEAFDARLAALDCPRIA
jgi:hypothetical protein